MENRINEVNRRNKENVQKLYLEEAPYYKRGYYRRSFKIWGKHFLIKVYNSKMFGNGNSK